MSFWEFIVILLVAFLVIKPERLPEMAHLLGRCMARFKKWQQQLFDKYSHWT